MALKSARFDTHFILANICHIRKPDPNAGQLKTKSVYETATPTGVQVETLTIDDSISNADRLELPLGRHASALS